MVEVISKEGVKNDNTKIKRQSHISPTGANRWCGTMAITATSRGVNENKKARTISFPAFSKHRNIQKRAERIGRD
jgi:hypothetical protein